MAYEKFTGEEYIDTDLVAKLNQDFDACGKLASNNTWTGNNYWNGGARFNSNLTICGSPTTPGDSSTYLWLGLKPEGSEQTPSIARNKQGDLVMYAADYRPCYLRSGIQTSFASVYNSDGTVEFSSLDNTPWGKYTKANGLELKVHKTPTVNNDVPNKKYVDDSIADAVANGDVNSAKYLNITNFIPSNSDFNDYKTPGEYQVQSNTEANTIANLPTSYNDATPRGGVLSVLIGFNAPRTSLVQIYRTYGSSYVASRTYQRCFYHENSSWTAWREIACTDEVGLLNQANTYTALNIFRANIAVSSGTTAGSQGQIILGNKPQSATVQANIISSTTGALNYIATENAGHYFRIGNNTASTSITTNDSETAILSHNAFEFARITNVGVAKWLGNANTATKLQTARTINGVSFDGTANITIADSTKLPIAGGTMTGDLTLKGNPTADLMAATKKYVDDSVASAGGGDVLAAGNNSFTGANTFQNLVTMVGGVVFTSGTTTLAWKNATQIVATINASTYTGNSATATKLATARTITANLASSTAGSFDGSANITVGVTGTLPIANGGTGATTAAAARTALGCAPAYTYSTTDLTAGSSKLTTGTLYIVYE